MSYTALTPHELRTAERERVRSSTHLSITNMLSSVGMYGYMSVFTLAVSRTVINR